MTGQPSLTGQINKRSYFEVKQTLLALAIIIMSLSVTSSKVDAQAVTMGAHYTCAGWADAKGEPMKDLIREYWLVGMMNGLALASGKDFWANIEQNQLIFWMDRYCDNNPLSDVVIGVGDLMVERFGRGWRS